MAETLYILLAYVIFAGLFMRLRMGPVVGLLVAGAVIGPSGIGLIHDVEAVATLAELGIVFLLFNVGLEIKIERLRLFGWRVYTLAIAQVALTAAAFAALARGFGLPPESAVLVGGALALSSTAVALQVLADLGRMLTQLGRLAIATLLVQDLMVGPLVVAANVLGAGDALEESLLRMTFGGVAAIGGIVLAVRVALPRAIRIVTVLGGGELFLGLVLLVVLGASWATHEAGLSAGLGAFLAGLLVADTEYRHQIAADIAPFRGLLLGLFFMAIGMGTDLAFALDQLAAVAAVAAALLFGKAALLVAIASALGYRLRLALQLGVLLGQGSEFSFVIVGIAVAGGLLGDGLGDTLTVAIALSMLAAPLVAGAGRRFLDRLEGAAASPLSELDSGTAELEGHVVVIGFGQVGMALTRHLLGLGVRVVVLDADSRRVRDARARGLPVYFGNGARSDVLRAVHIDRARLAVIALPDGDLAARILSVVRRLAPDTRLVVRAPREGDGDMLRRAGAEAVVIDSIGTAIELAERAVVFLDPEGGADKPRDADPARGTSAAG